MINKFVILIGTALLISGFYRQISGTNDPVRWQPQTVVKYGFCNALKSFSKDDMMFAFKKWQEALGDALTLQFEGYGGWAERQIWVCLDKKWNRGIHYKAAALAETEFSTWTGLIFHAKIFLNNFSYKWQKSDKSSKVLLDLKEIMLHEVGHALGLLHSSNKKSVMHANLSRVMSGLEHTLSAEDVERIRILYSVQLCEYSTGCSCGI